ncbi:CPBP family intramembrane metalloprotease [Paenibacillus sp. 5J-6]|uniref:CPBP family intramembrane metalloprotease n=2 Tax=Paenibacillus silvestris TaxID=2606219 RepID=A0A6L8UXK9_9BACL|nr:CPBP family intramembrane metalloprotease [Paenibacillus silvestris]
MMKLIYDRRIRNILLFSILAVCCGWVGRLVDLQVGRDANGSLGQLLWIVTPLLTMMLLRTFGGDGWQDIGIRFHFRKNVHLYLVSALFSPCCALLILLIGHDGLIDTTPLTPLFLSAFGMAILPSFIKNIFEELAWRGYLAPEVYALGWNKLLSHSYIGLIWAVWHFPYLFLFIDTTEHMVTFLPRLVLGVVLLSVVYGEIRLLTNSVWPAVLMHTMGNAFIDTLILKNFIEIRAGYSFLMMPSPDSIFSIVITGIVGFWLYRIRVKSRSS